MSALMVVRKHMTPGQARIATQGMTAHEIANLAWVLEALAPEELAPFVARMADEAHAISTEMPGGNGNAAGAPGAFSWTDDYLAAMLDMLGRNGYAPRLTPAGGLVCEREAVTA